MMPPIALWMMIASALAGSEDGKDNEISLELGSMGSRGDAWDALTYNLQLGSVGGRVGLAMSERLTLVADYQVGRYGGGAEVYGDGGDYDYQYLDLDLDLTAHQLSLGPKVDMQIRHWLRPYATVQALGVLGTLRLDEDPGDRDEGMTRYRSFAPGGVAALGVDLVAGRPRARIHPASHLELGYGITTNMSFSDRDAGPEAVDLGALGLGGFYLRWGVGLRF